MGSEKDEAYLNRLNDLKNEIKEDLGKLIAQMDASDLKKRIDHLTEQISDLEPRVEVSERRLNSAQPIIEQISGRKDELQLKLMQKPPFTKINVIVSQDPNLGPVAAQVFEYYVSPTRANELATKGEVLGIGLSGGRTLRAMVDCISQEYHALSLYPLSCPGLREDVELSVNTIIGLFCMKYGGGKVMGRQMPIDPELYGAVSPNERDKIINEIKKVIEDNVYYVFTGIGSLEEGAALFRLAKRFNVDLSGLSNQSLGNKRLVGEMFYRGLRLNGRVMNIKKLDDKVVGIRPNELFRMRRKTQSKLERIIGVAGGRGKVEAIYAACRGGYIDTLITDEEAADRLLKLTEG